MNWHDYFTSYLAGGKDKSRRKVKGNTYAEKLANGNIGLRFHATIVCEYWPNGNVTLRSGGWQTVTTQARIHDYSPARVYSVKGSWHVFHATDGKTAVKVQKCRACKGSGVGHGWYCPGARTYTYDGGYREIPLADRKPCEHGSSESHTVPGEPGSCYRCSGTGERDYGSKPIPTPFFDGIVVDMTGAVVGGKLEGIDPSPYVADTTPSVSGTTITNDLTAAIPGLLGAKAKCPECTLANAPIPVMHVVMHLNDVHKRSRAEIADWLDTLDANLSFATK